MVDFKRGGVGRQRATFARGLRPGIPWQRSRGRATRDAPSGEHDGVILNREHRTEIGVARLVAQVQRIVDESGDPEGFDATAWTSRWLDEPLPALNGVCPVDLLDTMEGQALVSNAIAQIQSGAYA